jgi:hypothetical protein
VLGEVAYYYSLLAAPTYMENFKEEEPPQRVETPPSWSLPFNVQHVVVSFVFGVLVAALLGMQWQALKRRRTAEPAATEPPAAPAPEADAAKPEGVLSAKSEGVMHQAPPS